MKRRRRLARATAAVLCLLLAGSVLAGCSGDRGDKHLLVWTALSGEFDMKGEKAAIKAFEKQNPGVTVDIVGKAGQFTGDNTSAITAVRGGNPPNVIVADRFTVAQQAAIGLLTDLQPFVDKDGGNFMNNYLSYAVDESSYLGDTYALPYDTDARGLFYNKDVMKQAGIDPSVLDPKNGPPTIKKVMRLAKKMNKTNKHGNYTRMGFIPWDAQGFYATWGLLHGAKYFDGKTCEVTLTEPAFQKAYQEFSKWAKELDYSKVQTFLATYRPPNQPPSQSPLYTGHLGMAIDGNFALPSIKKYAPKLNYGVTYLPVEHKGDPPFTWSGGFGVTMPKGASNQELTWKFMKFFAGEQGQRLYMKTASKIPTWKSLVEDKSVTGDLGIFPSMIKFSTNRPALPVGGAIANAMTASQEAVLAGMPPKQALQRAQDRVQPQMEQYCPFHLTHVGKK